MARRREERKLSQSELATMLRVSNTYVSDIEHGRNVPNDLEFIRLIAKALKVDVLALLVAHPRYGAVLEEVRSLTRHRLAAAWVRRYGKKRVRKTPGQTEERPSA